MRAVSIVAVRMQEVELLSEVELLPAAARLPEVEAHTSPTAVAHAVGNR
jgi:hypothetical protein